MRAKVEGLNGGGVACVQRLSGFVVVCDRSVLNEACT